MATKNLIDDVKGKILSGANWVYDPEQVKKEREEEEAKCKAEEPPKQRYISSHQVDELSEYLKERYGRLCKGELYKIKGYSPLHPMRVLTVDTGIMLIALSECLESRDTAITGLKKIMYRFLHKIDPKKRPDIGENRRACRRKRAG
jgi:hypothetical protein